MNIEIIPLPEPRLVPRHLLEQIKDRMFDIDEWYSVMSHMRRNGDNSNLFFALTDPEYAIKGALWMSVDALDKAAFVNFLTVDKELQGNGKILDKVCPFIAAVVKGLGLRKAFWMSTRPKAYARYGFLPSKNVLLEMSLEEWEDVGRQNKSRQHPVTDPAAAAADGSTDRLSRARSKSRERNPRSKRSPAADIRPSGPAAT